MTDIQELSDHVCTSCSGPTTWTNLLACKVCRMVHADMRPESGEGLVCSTCAGPLYRMVWCADCECCIITPEKSK